MEETLRIMVCEDEQEEQKTLTRLLAGSKVCTVCSFFPDGDSFLKEYYPGCCDLLLLDIFMKGMSGVDVAARVRAVDPGIPIAFITTSPDYTMEGYRYRVDRYLLKPIKQEALEEVLQLGRRHIIAKPSVSFLIQGRNQSVLLEEISYAEQSAHVIYIHLTDGKVLKTNRKLSELAELLPSPPFYQFHKSFLVNLAHVKYLDAELRAFAMDSGYAYIRRDSLHQAQETYSRFMFDQMGKQEGR